MRDLLKQRDELLAAIKRAKYWMAGSEAKRILEEAIASVKGNHTEQPLEMVESSAQDIVFYPAGSLGEEVHS